jgi:predicted metal-dependent hydrolase
VNSELLLGGTARVTLRPSRRARLMRLRVDPRTGGVVLSFPHRVSRRRAIEWASGQQQWIEAALAGVPKHLPLAPGAVIPWQGEPHMIDWSAGRSRTVMASDGRIAVGGPAELLERRLLRWMKSQALDVLTRETREIAALAGVNVDRVGVGDPVSRWGSCSSSGTIRYSWRLILAPPWVRRATVAHEVAHRVHMDHSRRFHALVERLLGADPKPARLWLRQHGAELHRIGRDSRPSG